MTSTTRPTLAKPFQYLFLATLLASFSIHAKILDDFNDNIKTGWSDTLNGGSVTEASTQFTITSDATAGAFTYSRKTSTAFTNLATHTLEFKVLVNSIGPGGGTTNGHAVLGWVPTGGALRTNGYSLTVGTNDVTIMADNTVLYSASGLSLPTANLFMALRMTPSGSDVIVKATVYNKADGRYNALFERTATNSPGIIGTGGNAALGALNDPSGAAASVAFDDLQVFDTVRILLDDFSG